MRWKFFFLSLDHGKNFFTYMGKFIFLLTWQLWKRLSFFRTYIFAIAIFILFFTINFSMLFISESNMFLINIVITSSLIKLECQFFGILLFSNFIFSAI